MTFAAKRITNCPPGFTDHIYKEVHGVSIPLRVWSAAPTQSKEPRPWLLWIHGGGMQAGKHYIPNSWVHRAFTERGYHVVSIAYRFIPEVWLKDISQDCLDALTWCREHLPQILGQQAVDVDSYIVAGDSAGGTLATLLGHLATPRPKVVIDLYGVVDMTDPQFYEPAKWTPPYLREWTKEQLAPFIESRDLTKACVVCPWDWELEPEMSQETLRTFWGVPDLEVTDQDYLRMDGFKYTGQKGKRLWLWIGGEECNGPEELQARAKEWSSLYLLDSTYPPTFIIHGVKDPVVRISQAHALAEKLKEKGVAYGEAYDPEGSHCFDQSIVAPEDKGWDEYIVPCMDFVDKHVKA